MLKSELKYGFDYDSEKYGLISILMSKHDRNLLASRDRLVPLSISDDEFWRNYFYCVEEIRMKHFLPNLLGEEIAETKRVENLKSEVQVIE